MMQTNKKCQILDVRPTAPSKVKGKGNYILGCSHKEGNEINENTVIVNYRVKQWVIIEGLPSIKNEKKKR